MFKIIFILFIFNYYTIFSQQKSIIELASAFTYSFSAPNNIIGIQEMNIYENDYSISNIKGTFGSGSSINLNISIFPNKNLGLGLTYTYFNSSNKLTKHIDLNNNSLNENAIMYGKSEVQIKQNLISPHFIFRVSSGYLTFFMKSGLIIPINSSGKLKTLYSYENYDMNLKSKIEEEEKFGYHFSFGFNNSIGFEKQILKHMKINFAIITNLFSLNLKNSRKTHYFVNGQNTISSLSFYEVNTNYLDDLNNFSNNIKYNSNIDYSKSKDELTKNHSFNSIGLSIGINYIFDKK
jgi:hypothetical protein